MTAPGTRTRGEDVLVGVALEWEPEVLPSLSGGRGLVACLLAGFLVTFLVTRFVTHAIRTGRGPFRDASVGGVHLHHEV